MANSGKCRVQTGFSVRVTVGVENLQESEHATSELATKALSALQSSRLPGWKGLNLLAASSKTITEIY